MSRPRAIRGPLTRAAILLLLTAAAWWVWLGRDAGWHWSPVSSASTSDVPLWRCLGCAVTVLVLTVEGHRRLDPRLAGPAATTGFAGGYAADVLPGDTTGLALVSVLLVLAGMAKASTALRELTAPSGGGRSAPRPVLVRRRAAGRH